MAGEADIYGTRVANGGGGTVSSGGVRAPDYRQVQGPEGVDTNLPDNGGAQRAKALSSVFKEFEGVSNEVAGKFQQHAGGLAGAASGDTGHPQYREGLARLTAYGNAFNNAATGTYAIQAEAQADADAARLRVQANKDPASFQATFTANRDAVLKNAPADAVPMLTELYNKKLAAGMAAISGDQAAELQLRQRQAYEVGIQQQTSRVAILQGSTNPQDQLQAMDEHTKLNLTIAGGVHSGLYSPAEAQAMQINSMRAITAQVFETQFDRELARPDGDPMGLLGRFRQAHIDNLMNDREPPVLSEDEFQKLMQNATTKFREERLAESASHEAGLEAQKLRFEAGNRYYTIKALSGELTPSQLAHGVASGDLDPNRATGLNTLLTTRDQKSDPVALTHARQDPRTLDMSPEEIAALPGISNKDKIALGAEAEKRRQTWEATQPVKDAQRALSVALKIPPGTPLAAMSDVQKKAYLEANQEMLVKLQALPPSQRDSSAGAVAHEVMSGVVRKEAAADAINISRARAAFIQRAGPNGSDPWAKALFEERLKQYDTSIAAAQAAAKGP